MSAEPAPLFSDHFSSVASNYAAFRPTYPDALFAWLAKTAPARSDVWDCACGSGQASEKLARYFTHVTATDASAQQIEQAKAKSQNPDKVTYKIAHAKSSGLSSQSVDLVTVAQAAHWFATDDFYDEVKRVLRPKGIIAVWTYHSLSVRTHPFLVFGNDPLNENIARFTNETLGSYWPPEREFVRMSYRTLYFPFAREIRPPSFEMTARWTLPNLFGYLRSWSAVEQFKKVNKIDPVDAFENEIAPFWGRPDQARDIRFKLHLRVARI